MIRRFDAWLGLRVLHPPIIWFCQWTRMTQFAVYRFGWWIEALWVLWRNGASLTGWGVFNFLFALGRTLSFGIAPDRPAYTPMGLRVLLLSFMLLDWMGAASQHEAPSFGLICAVIAEYAATITTIPPRKRREPKRRLAEVGAHV